MNVAEFFSQLRWRPRIGDPTVMGWLTVIAYGAAAALCLVAAFRNRKNLGVVSPRLRDNVWLGVALLMAFLCINKQLDLQSLLTDVGRVLAKQEGWYGQRRIVQRWFVMAVSMGSALALVFLVWKLKAFFHAKKIVLTGLTLLLTFIVIRAASFHHFDVFIRSDLLGVRVNWILELGAIALVMIGTVQSILRSRKE